MCILKSKTVESFWFSMIGCILLTSIVATPLPLPAPTKTTPLILSENLASLANQKNIENFDSQKFINITSKHTDDLLNSDENTLENTIDDGFALLVDNKTKVLQRFKQSIPVLEPVKIFLNTVNNGGFNHTVHFNKTRTLVSPGEVGENIGDNGTSIPTLTSTTASSAIETEAEREMINKSTDLKLLDCLGSIGGRIFGFLKQWFTASSGNALAAASASGGL